jgi:hypothetical protein
MTMPRGDKSSYTDKQKRKAEHIEESEKDQGRSEAVAERIAWATVNKQDGGGKKSGSATKKAPVNKTAAKQAATKAAPAKTVKKVAKKVARANTGKRATSKA